MPDWGEAVKTLLSVGFKLEKFFLFHQKAIYGLNDYQNLDILLIFSICYIPLKKTRQIKERNQYGPPKLDGACAYFCVHNKRAARLI